MTALEKLQKAIAGEKNGQFFTAFAFKYGGFELDYMGRYYAYVYEGSSSNVETEAEYGWSDYEEMLNGVIHETGRTVRQMLSEIADHDLEIEFDIPLPPGAAQTD